MDKLLHTSLFRAILKSLNRKVVSEKRLQTYFLKFARLITALCDDTDCLSALHTLNYTQIQFRFLLSRIHEPSVSLPPYITPGCRHDSRIYLLGKRVVISSY